MPQGKLPITAVVITKNEEVAIGRCLGSLSFCEQVLVIDSASTDRTQELARHAGAEVVNFTWNGKYPKKKQWGMDHPSVRHDWVFHMDGDEVVSNALELELREVFTAGTAETVSAFDLSLEYHFSGRRLRYGHKVHKRSLVRRSRCEFPEVGDLGAPGITEVEGHYQPTVAGSIGRLRSKLIHDDPDPVGSWVSRHNRYADWEAYLRISPDTRLAVRSRRSLQGQLFDRVPMKALSHFIYGYLFRGGFLDGRAGLDYAYALSFYYWLIDAKTRELKRSP